MVMRRNLNLNLNLILKENKLKEALSAIPSADETKRLANLESDLANLREENGNLKNAVDNASSQFFVRVRVHWRYWYYSETVGVTAFTAAAPKPSLRLVSQHLLPNCSSPQTPAARRHDG